MKVEKLNLAGITRVSSFWTVVWGVFGYLLCLLHGGTPWVQNLPTSGHKSRLHCRKIAVTELLFLERFEQTQLLPRSVTQTEVLSVEQCSSTCRFLLLFLWFTVTSFWKKNSYLTLYLTSKLRLVIVSSAIFVFHQIMFVCNVCKS